MQIEMLRVINMSFLIKLLFLKGLRFYNLVYINIYKEFDFANPSFPNGNIFQSFCNGKITLLHMFSPKNAYIGI
jgi:hypothetical protein